MLSRLTNCSSDFQREIDKDDQGNPVGYKYTGIIFLVLEYMDNSLEGILSRPGVSFTAPQVKCYMKQLLDGLYYCHANQVLHRDIKAHNILINNEGCLKLADFSLSRWRPSDDVNEAKFEVTSLWHRYCYALITFIVNLHFFHTRNINRIFRFSTGVSRPPELLLETQEISHYGPAIDMWSVGCVFAKLLGQRVMEGLNKAGFCTPNP
ncbi:cyclin-dependent kinase C-1-like [Magnolia sinica]|uniref:cyclin-dependent kinase C-1-like n=1 Tax=Magnolia sinica TaxID=86752 RepID=UPI00265B5D9F|nr:cyclin-dependent kinase C-1-like [Magnolia sinica]